MKLPNKRAHAALEAYTKVSLPKTELEEDPETVVSDLIADLMHFCDEKGLRYDSLRLRAERHYTDEEFGR